MNALTRILVNRHVRRQMQMTRSEYRQFVDDCFNSTPWYGARDASIRRGIAQSHAGKVRPAREVLDELGINPDGAA